MGKEIERKFLINENLLPKNIHGEKYSSGIWAGYPFPGTHEEGVVPYTINGKKVELAVKQVIQNIEVKNKDVLAK